MKPLFFSFVFLLFCIGAVFCREAPIVSQVSLTKHTDLVLSHYKNSVLHCTKDKVYLKPEMIVSENDRLWLYNNDNIPLEIPMLCCDTTGCYISTKCIHPICNWLECTNPECGFVWRAETHPSDYCPRCGWQGVFCGFD